ncbi:DISARM system SNF2-like helicase DrmD [Rothia sp. BD8]|uniref:DISARM system SNF2-like helicase DrmD n=1 Tax=Rothia sp. BD8 TaxID=2953894 RepID=UPI00383D7C32
MPFDAPTRRPQLPEPGQVVEVRGSRWAVTDISVQGLGRSPADETRPETQHVVALQSTDEDRLGEELSVVWELEVGNTLLPDQGLPVHLTSETFDDPNTLGAYVDAVRWGAVTSADESSFQSPFRSGANVEAYQLEPLRRALSSARTNLLLADDVGLGKTIEAGLVIQELLLRHRAQTVAIVCPPSLAIKWQEEMREKFGLDFVIINRERLAEDRRRHGLGANPFRLHRRVIVSMAWLPTPRARRLLREIYQTADGRSAQSYAFDILVVDEAHHVAPSSPSSIGGGRGYAVDSKRTIAVAELAKRCEHRLFLSATPHNGYSESFTALMEMIDDRRFARGATIDEKALADVTVRRLKTQLTEKDFKDRQIKTIPFEPERDEEENFSALVDLLEASAKANGKSTMGDLLGVLLRKRLLSSPWSFALTLEQYNAAPDASLPALEDPYTEVIGSDQSDEEEGLPEHPEFEAMRHAKTARPLSEATPQQIDRLTAWGRGFEGRPDSRLSALITFLDGFCRIGELWSNERVVIFTEYAATLEWIQRVLESKGYSEARLAVIQGSTSAEERELIRARFTAPPEEQPIRVLLATDAAGEGIDLQAHCHRLINYDIPFNPSRLEQRIGRIDRYGQRNSPEIYYLAPTRSSSAYTNDLKFFRRIAEKVATVKGDLGSVNSVVDADVQEHFSLEASPARTVAKNASSAQLTALKGDLHLNAQLTNLASSYDETKTKLHLTPFNARRVVETALAASREPGLKINPDDMYDENDPATFTVGHLGHRWQSTLAGLDTRLNPGVYRPITFDETAAHEDPEVVHIHLGHALMQKSARLLRSGLFGASSQIHRATAVVESGIPESCVAAVSRLVLVGRGGLRLHEEVFVTGIRIRGNAMAEDKVHDLLDKVLDRRDLVPADRSVRFQLAEAWNAEDSKMRRRLEEAMRARARKRQDAVQENLNKRRDTDLKRVSDIYAKFRENLHRSLQEARAEEHEATLMLFADDQQAQRRRDIRAMEDRLEALGGEEERELSGIRDRYTDVHPYVSAAAVVFALTPTDADKFGGNR